MKKLILTSLVSIIIILGGYGIYLGIVEIWGEKSQELVTKIEERKSTIEERKSTIEEYRMGSPTSMDLTPTYDSFQISPLERLTIFFESDMIFEGDIVKVKGAATNVKEHIQEIVLIINDGSWSVSGKTLPEIKYEEKQAEKVGRVIVLTSETNPSFSSEIPMKFLSSGEIHATGIFQFVNNTVSPINIDGKLLPVYSQADKLQVETNKAILKQIDQTELSNFQQERTNQLFLGLSIIAIALAPIISGCDFLYRIHIDTNRKEDDGNYKIYR